MIFDEPCGHVMVGFYYVDFHFHFNVSPVKIWKNDKEKLAKMPRLPTDLYPEVDMSHRPLPYFYSPSGVTSVGQGTEGGGVKPRHAHCAIAPPP